MRDNPSIKFVIPESGGTLWSDNFMIPVTSDKPALATEWINYWYDPVNAAKLTEFIQYISPVDGVADELTKLGGDAAALGQSIETAPDLDLLVGQTGADFLGTLFGGIRPPDVQAPLGQYFESNTGPGFCGLFGGFRPFDEAKLQELFDDWIKTMDTAGAVHPSTKNPAFVMKAVTNLFYQVRDANLPEEIKKKFSAAESRVRLASSEQAR